MKDGVPFAIDAKGNFRDVGEVENGLSCGCFCADCRGPVVARQGELRAHHFAHHDRRECRHALESSIFGKIITQLTQDGFPLFVPAAGSRQALLNKMRLNLRSADAQRFFAKESVMDEAVMLLSRAEVVAGELRDSSLSAPEIRFPPIGLEIHLLSHRKKSDDLRRQLPQAPLVLAIDLKAYAKIWWDTCDAFREERIEEAISATHILTQWLTGSGAGREWIHNATMESQAEILRKWILERGEEYSAEAARIREDQARLESARAAAAAADRAEREEAKRKADDAKAAARHRAWRAPLLEPDQAQPAPIGFAKLAAPNAWLSALLAAEADLYWSTTYTRHLCLIKPGEWVPELAQAHIPKEAEWFPIYQSDMPSLRREKDSIRSRR